MFIAADLNYNTNDIRKCRNTNSVLSTEFIANPGSSQTSSKCSNTQQTNDCSLTSGAEDSVIAKSGEEVGHLEEA